MPIKSFPLGPLETNCHVIHSATHAIVVDAGGNPRPVLKYLEAHKLVVAQILVTHLHFDHIYGNAALAAATGATIYANPEDAYLLDTELGRGGAFGLPLVDSFAWEPILPGDRNVEGMSLRVLATPGHTPGSLSFHIPADASVIVGDLLFRRGVGRTDFPGGNTDTLRRSIEEQIFVLPDETVVYSGHGPHTTVGDEKTNNPYVGSFTV